MYVGAWIWRDETEKRRGLRTELPKHPLFHQQVEEDLGGERENDLGTDVRTQQ